MMSVADFDRFGAKPVNFDVLSSDTRSMSDATGIREFRFHFSGYEENDGTICARSSDGVTLAAAQISEFVESLPVFSPDTRLVTERGEVEIKDLQAGDHVLTRDRGLQEVLWIGARDLNWRILGLNPLLRPLVIRAGALGAMMPERDLHVSPARKFLTHIPGSSESGEWFVAARDLIGQEGIEPSTATSMRYMSLSLRAGTEVMADGGWTSLPRVALRFEAVESAAPEQIAARESAESI